MTQPMGSDQLPYAMFVRDHLRIADILDDLERLSQRLNFDPVGDEIRVLNPVRQICRLTDQQTYRVVAVWESSITGSAR